MSTQAAWEIPEFTMSDRLRKAREKVHLDQAELAEELGVSRATISNAETGTRTPMRITLRAWAMRTGVPVEWLETGQVPTTPDGDGSSLMQPTEPYVLRRHLTVMHDIAA